MLRAVQRARGPTLHHRIDARQVHHMPFVVKRRALAIGIAARIATGQHACRAQVATPRQADIGQHWGGVVHRHAGAAAEEARHLLDETATPLLDDCA